MYNLIQQTDAYSKKSWSLRRYYWDEPALENNHNIIDFPANIGDGVSFKFKQQITGKTRNSCTKDIEIMVPLKYLSNFWRALEMPLISCEISLQLRYFKDCIIVSSWYYSKSKAKIWNN